MGQLLEGIQGPHDLKKMSTAELEKLAREIRELMTEVVSRRGGHLASSLGVVEITLALHKVFQSPTDKIIWDVGHQSYAHKIITGRKEEFRSLRYREGISGFPRPEESPHDAFGTGHSSTSISAALGLALARDLRGDKYSVVAVIGDGALTGGMALEALNFAGELDTNLIVVLNDNEMSINQNVGGLNSYLARLRTDPKYYRLKEDLEHVLERIPAIGKTVVRSVERLKDSLKYLVLPGMLFEELGFTYLGPIDGHNIGYLLELLRQARATKGPVFLHVATTKGKGYPPAERQPHLFHGVGPFDLRTGSLQGAPVDEAQFRSYSDIFGSVMVEQAAKDPQLVALTAAMAGGTGLVEYSIKWPDRFFDVGIAEQNAVTMAAGLAVGGYRPVVAVYSTFLQRAYDQVAHDVCLQKLPVTLAVDRAGLVGEDGETHNGLFDLAYLRHLPELVLMAPADGLELACMLKTAFSLDGPAAVRYPKGRTAEPPPLEECPELTVGQGRLLQEGEDLLLLPIGSMVLPALQAGELLRQEGIRCCIIDPRFVTPLDRELIARWARRCGRLLTVEEHVLRGGFGSAVLEFLQEEGLLQQVKAVCLGLPHPFTGQGKRSELLAQFGLTGEGIAGKAREFCRVPGEV